MITVIRPETLALDIGSTGVRAARFDGRGLQRGPAVERRHRGAATGRVDAEALLSIVVEAVDRLDLRRIGAVAVSALWHSAVPLDAEGRPLAEAVTWETPMPPWVRDRVEAAADAWSREAAGAYLHSSYASAAFPFLCDERVARIADLGSWIAERLSGRRLGWSETVAAASGLWLQDRRTWNRPLFDALGIPDRLVPEVWAEPVTGTGTPVPGLAGAVWLPVAGDGLCHNLGHAAVGPETLAATVGTSGGVRAVLPDPAGPLDAAGLWHYRCAERLHAVGGAVSSAGNALEWARRFTGLPFDWARYRGEARAPELHVDPAVYGRRGPDYPWDATGAITGLRPSSTLADVRDAFALDIWRTFREHLDAIRGLLGPPAAVRTAGGVVGGDRDAVQMLADALDTGVQRVDLRQPSLAGAGVLGAQFLRDGRHDPLAAATDVRRGALGGCDVTEVVEPRPDWAELLRTRWSR
ncbi:FGGY-family carbohydrate kinase [Glycomyces xiaoerkulensis]|uniref:FGGY-family carbohydrate kinase n=1 Tax=Glycomyces xiaoerkulensis TaxID=2038139 RepID=UPI000C25E70A|nr:FGGY-family carbohydrate kinase [Glycomyces xiaoerkulensis]